MMPQKAHTQNVKIRILRRMISRLTHIIIPHNRLLSKGRQDVLVPRPIQRLTANNSATQDATQPE
jgi:hypothetical protein